MKTKRITAMLLSLMVLMIAVFSGCSQKQKEEPTVTQKKTQSEKQTESKATTTEGREMVGNMYKTGLPIVKDKVSLKMVAYTYPDQPDFGEMPFFKNLEEKTNVHIEWDCIEQNIYNEKKNILLAANELPDAFFGPNAFTIDDANKYGPMGTVIPLDELIDKYSVYYKNVIDETLIGGLTTCFDGNKYTLGTIMEMEVRNYPDLLCINKLWLDNLNLEIPETLDEFYEVLKAFRDEDPNDNGKKDELPYVFMKFDHLRGYGSFFGAFGLPDAVNGGNITPYDHFLTQDGKVIFTADKPEYKEAIAYMHEFFKDELFDKEGFVNDRNQFYAKGSAPEMIVGSFYGWAPSQYVKGENSSNYIVIPPLKGPSGKEPVVRKRINHINLQLSGFAITKDCKHPEIAFRWADQFYDVKTSIEAQYGPIGVCLEETADGKYTRILTPEGEDTNRINSPHDNAPKYLAAEIVRTAFVEEKKEKKNTNEEKLEGIEKYYLNAKTIESLPLLTFKPEEIKINQTIGLDIVNLVREKQAQWLLEGGIENEWDSYIAKLKQLKLDEYVEHMQSVYDRAATK